MAKEKPAFDVIAADREDKRDPRDVYWTKVGGAWPSRDGTGFNITLNAHPIGRTLLLRVPKEKDDKENTAEQPMNDEITY